MKYQNNNSKIILTGGSGFLGTHLLKNELLHGCLAIGRTKPQNYENFKEINFSEDKKIEEVLLEKDVVIHLAARNHVMNDKSTFPLIKYREVNTELTLKLAKKAANAGVKRFIFISTVKVLGEKTMAGSSFKNDDVLNPQDPYSISKAEAEEGLKEIGNQYNMEIVIIRPPLVFGKGVKGNFKSLLSLVRLQTALPFGSIKNKRSFVSIDNLSDLILTCIDHPKAINQIFMVSDDHDLSTPEFILKLAKAGRKKIFLFRFPVILLYISLKLLGKLGIYERLCSSMVINIEYTKKQLNWKPPFKIEDSLKDCW